MLDPFRVSLYILLALPASCSSCLWLWTNFTQVHLTSLKGYLMDSVVEHSLAPTPVHEQPRNVGQSMQHRTNLWPVGDRSLSSSPTPLSLWSQDMVDTASPGCSPLQSHLAVSSLITHPPIGSASFSAFLPLLPTLASETVHTKY